MPLAGSCASPNSPLANNLKHMPGLGEATLAPGTTAFSLEHHRFPRACQTLTPTQHLLKAQVFVFDSFLKFVYLFIYYQGTTGEGQFSLSTIWVPRIEPKSPSLAASAFIHQANTSTSPLGLFYLDSY